jgi:hypothetical protein
MRRRYFNVMSSGGSDQSVQPFLVSWQCWTFSSTPMGRPVAGPLAEAGALQS